MQATLPAIFLGLAGLVFCLLGGVYSSEGFDDLRRDEFEFAWGTSCGTAWHRTYSVHGHPVLFAVRILIDATGAIGGFGVGLFMFGTLISIGTKNAGPVVKKMEAAGKPFLITTLITFGAHFVLVLIPYLLAFIDIL